MYNEKLHKYFKAFEINSNHVINKRNTYKLVKYTDKTQRREHFRGLFNHNDDVHHRQLSKIKIGHFNNLVTFEYDIDILYTNDIENRILQSLQLLQSSNVSSLLIMCVKSIKNRNPLFESSAECLSFFTLAKIVIMQYKNKFENKPNICKFNCDNIMIVGDLHGNEYALFTVLNLLIDKNGSLKYKVCFTGDYCDRGKYNFQVLMAIISLQLLYPNDIIVLRGNHESTNYWQMSHKNICQEQVNCSTWQCETICYTSYRHLLNLLQKAYENKNQLIQYLDLFSILFNAMQIIALIIIKNNGKELKILAMHGCVPWNVVIDTNITNLNEFITVFNQNDRKLTQPELSINTNMVASTMWEDAKKINTMEIHPGLYSNEHHNHSSDIHGVAHNNRSFLNNGDTLKVCNKLGIDFIVRGHEYKKSGYEFTHNKVLTNHSRYVQLQKGEIIVTYKGSIALIDNEEIEMFVYSKPEIETIAENEQHKNFMML